MLIPWQNKYGSLAVTLEYKICDQNLLAFDLSVGYMSGKSGYSMWYAGDFLYLFLNTLFTHCKFYMGHGIWYQNVCHNWFSSLNPTSGWQ